MCKTVQLGQLQCLGSLFALYSLLVFTVPIVVPCWHFMFMYLLVLVIFLCHK